MFVEVPQDIWVRQFLKGKTYKAVEITKPGTFRLVEKPVVGPGEEQVRIRVEACGVCHSDAGTVEGQLPGVVYPRVPGHEAIGRIEEVGRRVTTWKVGQRVGIGFFLEGKTEPARPVAAATRHIARTPLSLA
jgi:D-arabinose 1-dehydrogenase-like Zn-dependent alcohol dehydrogenase